VHPEKVEELQFDDANERELSRHRIDFGRTNPISQEMNQVAEP
jgi:hypothetical protein